MEFCITKKRRLSEFNNIQEIKLSDIPSSFKKGTFVATSLFLKNDEDDTIPYNINCFNYYNNIECINHVIANVKNIIFNIYPQHIEDKYVYKIYEFINENNHKITINDRIYFKNCLPEYNEIVESILLFMESKGDYGIAAIKNNCQLLYKFALDNFNIDNNESELMIAASEKININMIKILIVDNCICDDVAFINFLKCGNIVVIELLIESYPNIKNKFIVNQQDFYHNFNVKEYFKNIFESKNDEFVIYIINKIIFLNTEYSSNIIKNPLFLNIIKYCIINDNLNILKYIEEKTINKKFEFSYDPYFSISSNFHYIIKHKSLKCLQYILDKYKIDFYDFQTVKSLHFILQSKNNFIFDEYLKFIKDKKIFIIKILIHFCHHNYLINDEILHFLIKNIKLNVKDCVQIYDGLIKHSSIIDNYLSLCKIINLDYESLINLIIKHDKPLFLNYLLDNKLYEINDKNINNFVNKLIDHKSKKIQIYEYLFSMGYIKKINISKLLEINRYELFEKVVNNINLNIYDLNLLSFASSDKRYIKELKLLLSKNYKWNIKIYNSCLRHQNKNYINKLFNPENYTKQTLYINNDSIYELNKNFIKQNIIKSENDINEILAKNPTIFNLF